MKIAIAGYGVEGQANYAYWSQDPANEITIVDEAEAPKFEVPTGAQTILGPGAFERLDGFDMVIRTAGLAPRKIKTDGKIWSATNEFFEKCQAPIIGVTGTKGKGTTSSLIASILEAAGKKVWLVGNIGLASLEVLDQIQASDIVVYELSSFQLWDIEKSPQTAVVLLIEADHQDVHQGMDDYVAAKANIAKYQSSDDLVIFNAANDLSRGIAEASAARKIGYPEQGSAHFEDGFFFYGEQKLCSTDMVKIPGRHNLENAVAAINATWQFVQNGDVIGQGLSNFKGLPHRLAYVATVNDVDYYDDSIATTPSSAIAGLRAFDRPKVIILGGSYKGSDFSELATELLNHDVRAILIGDEAERIAEACREVGFENFEIMLDATADKFTRRAQELAQPGSVVLLSPSAASFGLFKNYVDRGERFVAAVKSLS